MGVSPMFHVSLLRGPLDRGQVELPLPEAVETEGAHVCQGATALQEEMGKTTIYGRLGGVWPEGAMLGSGP